MVENLSKRFFNAFRCIAMDNYFSSIPLPKKLFLYKISLIGTLRSNKNEIPESFLADKKFLVAYLGLEII